MSKSTPPPDPTTALKTMRKAYGHLHEIVSDIIESGRLKEGDIPDDYQALVAALAECNNADRAAVDALRETLPEAKPLENYSVIITRDVTESTVVEVAATDPEQAEELALEKLSNTIGATWETDDGSWDQSEPYVTDAEEISQ